MKTKDFIYFILVVVFSVFISPSQTAHAELIVHDYVTDDTYTYKNTEVSYVVNGQKISTGYPGLILSDGSAVGSFHDIFELPLGIKSSYQDGNDSFTITYQTTTLKMTLGNQTVLVNGKTQVMPQAPQLYSFQNQDKKYLYVPTRFVAEALGFTYQWDAASATSTITRPKSVFDGTTPISYSGPYPAFTVNGFQREEETYPCYVFQHTTIVPLKYLTNTGLCSYDYREEEKLIVLTRNDVMVRFVIDSPIAYINDTLHVLSTVPRMITPYDVTKPEIYLPAEFTLSALGYNVTVDETTFEVTVTGADLGNNAAGEQATTTESVSFDSSSYRSELFSYTAHTQLVDYYTKKGYCVPKRIVAYSCNNSDAIFFEGITKEQLTITDKFDLLDLQMSNSFNPFGTKLYYEPENSYLNYFGIKGQNALCITLLKSSDFVTYSYNIGNGCVLHLCYAENKERDKLIPKKMNSVTGDYGKITLPQTTEELLPEVVGDKSAFTIQLPEHITKKDILDEDDYNNLRFILKIPGNYVSYFSNQEVYQPVSSLRSFTYRYNASENRTYITFNTSKIQGYRFSLEQHILTVQIDDPNKLYDKIIVLDAGHGGIDPGTIRGTVYEKNINFNVINLYAASYFKDSDIKVYYTRTTDTKIALETRAALASKVGADFFISFHVNSNTNSAVRGTSVYYSSSNNQPNASGLTSKTLGSMMLNKLLSVMGTKNAGLLTQKFVVIHENTVPAILIEIGFLSNDTDYAMLTNTTNQKKAAKAIFDVVNEIFAIYERRPAYD